MPNYTFLVNGQRHVFEGPDQATTAQFARQWAARQASLARAPDSGQTLQGMAEQFGRGAVQSVSGMADQVRNILDPGMWAKNAFTLSEGPAALARAALTGRPPQPIENPGVTVLRNMSDGPAQRAAAPITSVQPRNEAERIARTVGAFSPGAASPGSLARRAAQVFLPALGSESARSTTADAGGGVTAQNIASLIGGLAGGVGADGAVPDLMGGRDPTLPVNAQSPREAAVQALEKLQIPVTPGQRAGGSLGWLEDQAMSTTPALGGAIRGARLRQNDALNRAAINTALAPLGETLPAGVQIGDDALAHAEARLTAAKNEANGYALNVAPDVEFGINMSDISSESAFDVPSWMRQRLNPTLEDTLMQLFRTSPGGDFRGALAKIQKNREAIQYSPDPTERAFADHLGVVEAELNDLVGRRYPLFKQAQKAIAESEANLSVLRDATDRPGAGTNGFTATQLNSAVLAREAAVPKFSYAGPDLAVSGLAKNAVAVMGSGIPDASPPPTPASVGVLGLPSIPYLMMGRGVPNAFESANPRAPPVVAPDLPSNAMTPQSAMVPTSITALSRAAAAQQAADQGQQGNGP